MCGIGLALYKTWTLQTEWREKKKFGKLFFVGPRLPNFSSEGRDVLLLVRTESIISHIMVLEKYSQDNNYDDEK